MHIEVFNEDPTYDAQDATDTVDAVDAADAVDGVNEEALIDVASFALSRMDVHSEAELNIYIVDEDTIADLHVQWLDLEGPTDVMSFQWTSSRPVGGRMRTNPVPRCWVKLCCALALLRSKQRRRGIA